MARKVVLCYTQEDKELLQKEFFIFQLFGEKGEAFFGTDFLFRPGVVFGIAQVFHESGGGVSQMQGNWFVWKCIDGLSGFHEGVRYSARFFG